MEWYKQNTLLIPLILISAYCGSFPEENSFQATLKKVEGSDGWTVVEETQGKKVGRCSKQ